MCGLCAFYSNWYRTNSTTSNSATHLIQGLMTVNSYPQIGHSLLLASIFMAQEGHSFSFTFIRVKLGDGGELNKPNYESSFNTFTL